ncbi:hypothetical protein GCM10018785_22970 [Streptomyces longispororuber]|uniref:Uncharacterized protein n=1 Tax=Streptomyces longispororuber TaxID=68230 RepID=A0A918ZI61_9ACTN|nr:hypothetical protein GCM10018785_22970 [Streptomyces longispororuber]
MATAGARQKTRATGPREGAYEGPAGPGARPGNGVGGRWRQAPAAEAASLAARSASHMRGQVTQVSSGRSV